MKTEHVVYLIPMQGMKQDVLIQMESNTNVLPKFTIIGCTATKIIQ